MKNSGVPFLCWSYKIENAIQQKIVEYYKNTRPKKKKKDSFSANHKV